jgi:serine/threonine protein kinase
MSMTKNIGALYQMKVLFIDVAKDFVTKLLLVNPEQRMTAKVALTHPWLKTQVKVDLLPNVKKNFNARKTFKKAVLAVTALNKVQSNRNLLGDTKPVEQGDHLKQ